MSLNNTPFFILGNPRSGTSLLRLILNAHPNIVVPPESGFLQWWYPKYRDWSSKDLETRVSEFVQDLLSSKKIEAYCLNKKDLEQYIFLNKPCNYGDLIALVYRYYSSEKELLIWGDKNNYYIDHIPLLKKIYPEAKFIHLVRDGRDVACSYLELNRDIDLDSKYRPKLPNEISNIADDWKKNNLLIEQELVETDQIRVRFEDVVLNFDSEMNRILSFLNVPWSDEIVNFNLKNDEPLSTLKWKKKTTMPIQKNVIKRFENDLNNNEIEIFTKNAESLLKKYGYQR